MCDSFHSLEYDGSPRRFGMSSNDDTENQLQSASKQSNLIQSRAMPLNYPSPTPARPGFPQRVVSYDQHMSRKSPEPYSYSDHKGLATYTATSKLIPTTFINSNAYEEERETIHEDAETNSFQDEPSVTNRNASRQDETFESSAQQQQPQQYKSESASVFQVTSPTEENIPTSTFDYLYEFSETRKVLEEFFKCPESDKIKELEKFSDFNESDDSLVSIYSENESVDERGSGGWRCQVMVPRLHKNFRSDGQVSNCLEVISPYGTFPRLPSSREWSDVT